VLLSSGYIAGGTIAGVVAAFMEFLPTSLKNKLDFSKKIAGTFIANDLFPIALFSILVVTLAVVGSRRSQNQKS
jgi:hypothetical protein